MIEPNITRRRFLGMGAAAAGVFALSGFGALVGCANSADSNASDSSSSTTRRASHFVEDMSGTQVEVPNRLTMIGVIWTPANAIVGLLGQTYKLCATTEAYKRNEWAEYVFPEIAEIPSVIDNGRCDVDKIVEIDPCVTLAEASQAEDIDAIRQTGLSVMDVSFNTFDGMKKAVDAVAQAIGDDADLVAQSWASVLDDNIDFVANALQSATDEEKPGVLHLVSEGDLLKASGTQGLAAEWISYAGGRNVATSEDVADVTAADVEALAPDVVIVGGSDATEQVEVLLSSPEWAGVPAVMSRRVFANPVGLTEWDGPTPEEALQVLWAGEKFYPEYVDHLDVVSKTRDFYEKFYGFRISKCDAVGIMERKTPEIIPDCEDPAPEEAGNE